MCPNATLGSSLIKDVTNAFYPSPRISTVSTAADGTIQVNPPPEKLESISKYLTDVKVAGNLNRAGINAFKFTASLSTVPTQAPEKNEEKPSPDKQTSGPTNVPQTEMDKFLKQFKSGDNESSDDGGSKVTAYQKTDPPKQKTIDVVV